VGTIDAFWEAHMDLLGKPPSLNLNDRSWIIHTRVRSGLLLLSEQGAVIKDSMITDDRSSVLERSLNVLCCRLG